MTLRHCSPARQNDGRLYGGAGVASSAEEGKKWRHVPPPPSASTSLRAPLSPPLQSGAQDAPWGENAGGDAPPRGVERPSALGPHRWAASASGSWQKGAGPWRSSRSSARLCKAAARSGPRGHWFWLSIQAL